MKFKKLKKLPNNEPKIITQNFFFCLKFTLNLSTPTDGLAEPYKRNNTFIVTPTNIPTSKRINKQHKKVAAAGNISISVNQNKSGLKLNFSLKNSVLKYKSTFKAF